jgi:hypothetical protein
VVPSRVVAGSAFTVANLKFTLARVSPIATATTVSVSGGGPLDAPQGQVYYTANLTLRNATGQPEPGINAGGTSDLRNVSFAVTAQEAGVLGETFTPNGQALGGATGPSCVPTSGSGVVNEAFVTSAGNYCLLATGVMVIGINPSSPDSGISPPQLAAGQTETLSVAYGPVQQLPIIDVDLFATNQGTVKTVADSGFRIPAAGDPNVTYTSNMGTG